ncbi:MAG: NusG domain II-containing protein, partial [Bacilli bacterium]|nr:NusG domain II-containing protein [Bacilli bacterium]
MHKNDMILIVIILIIALIIFIVPKINSNQGNKIANVYYENKLIKTIDLSSNLKQEYNIKGYNGNIVIETKDNMIRVKTENSPLHLCSKQGWVENSHEVIVCLPNRIIIKIEDN